MSAKPRIVSADTPTPRRAKKRRRGRTVELRVMGVGADEEGGLLVRVTYGGLFATLRVPGVLAVAIQCGGESYREILEALLHYVDLQISADLWPNLEAFRESRQMGGLSLAEQFALLNLLRASEPLGFIDAP